MNEAFSYAPTAPTAMDRERLIKAHLPTLEFFVDRMRSRVPAYMTRDEIYSAGMMGLLDASNRYDSARGVQFKTFAEQRIRGAIIDEARKMDSFSRSLREKQSRLADAHERLEQRLGRTPEEAEVAATLGLEVDHYRQQLAEVAHLGIISLHETLDPAGEGRTLLETLQDQEGKSPLESLEATELTRELAGYLQTLTEKECQVVSLYYYEELSQSEIAEVLSLSEGRVSQLHSQALIKLKGKLSRKRIRRNV